MPKRYLTIKPYIKNPTFFQRELNRFLTARKAEKLMTRITASVIPQQSNPVL